MQTRYGKRLIFSSENVVGTVSVTRHPGIRGSRPVLALLVSSDQESMLSALGDFDKITCPGSIKISPAPSRIAADIRRSPPGEPI
jgi:hypothetical protein